MTVAFRGTVPAVLETILANAEICLVEDPANSDVGRVHCGFQEAVDAVAEPLVGILKQQVLKPLFITGHSLGAAMAFLFAARLLRTKTYTVRGLYTFGSPRSMTANSFKL